MIPLARRRLLGAILLAALAATGTGPVSVGASAATTTPALQSWYGTVTRVVDGDTVEVDVSGDGKGPVTVRNAAIQSTELNRATNSPECHSTEAYARMQQLLPVGAKVRLQAYDANSTSGTDASGQPRPIRYLDRYDSATGTYSLDVQRVLLREGHALWKPEPVETARQETYHRPMAKAMAERRGLFDEDHCGVGPSAGARLRMWINYEADGDDLANLSGEYIRIQNSGSSDVPIAGWKLRDPSQTFTRQGSSTPHTYFTFPAGSVLRAGSFVTVYPTSGSQDVAGGRFYLAVTRLPFFANITDPSLGYPGKAIYLLDPQLDFRAWADYPCLFDCSVPTVHISAVSATGAQESVSLKVDAGVTSTIDLSGVVVTNDGWVRELRPGTSLAPGETLTVLVQGDAADTRLVQHWRHTGWMFEDGGDTIVLRTEWSVVLDTYSYGSG